MPLQLFSSTHNPSLLHDLPGPQTQHLPETQTPPPEQSLKSATAVCTQPAFGWQLSVVQESPSSHAKVPPPRQVVPWQVSLVVHVLPSLQVAPGFGPDTQPLIGLHALIVQGLPSSQFNAEAATQMPPLHVSPLVHTLLSSQVLPSHWPPQPSLQALPSQFGLQSAEMQVPVAEQLGVAPPQVPQTPPQPSGPQFFVPHLGVHPSYGG